MQESRYLIPGPALKLPEPEYDVEVTFDWKYEGKTGIGSYEFWGHPGFDEGDPVYSVANLQVHSIQGENDSVPVTSDISELVRRWIEINVQYQD